jgi:sugar transferase (PEP-CTERM/EpsH1 system associated)
MRRLNVLWLSHFVPFPPKGGCFQRSYNLIARVAASHDIHLVAMKHKRGTHPEEETRLAETELLRYCASVHIIDISKSTRSASLALRGLTSLPFGSALTVTVFDSPSFRRTIRSVMREHSIDVAHLDTISLAQYLDDLGSVPAVMTHHGAESFMIRRRIWRERNPIKRWFFFFEWRALQRYERRMCPLVASNLVVSAADRDILAVIAPDARFAVVENGVDIDYFKPIKPNSAPALIFAGRLDQYSNREGILFFMRDVWPSIKKTHPNTVVNIIGSNPPDALLSLARADSNVKVHGFVSDVRPYFQSASVAICPIRDGGGTRIKVLDALAQGIPIVATTIACEGLDAVSGRDLLIADTPTEFARQIARVFEDAELRATLGANARALAERSYAWDSIAKKLVQAYSEQVRDHATGALPHGSLGDIA